MKTKSAASMPKAPVSVERLQRGCERLQKEHDRLREELVRVSAECDQYRRAVGNLMAAAEKIEFDEEAVLAEAATSQPIEECLAELEAEVSGQCRPRKRRRTK